MAFREQTVLKSGGDMIKSAIPHNLSLENRAKLVLSGVTDVDSFDENTILLYTQMGELTIKGKGLHINAMNVDTGDMTVEGDIWSLVYGDKDKKHTPTIIGKLFR